MLDNLYILQVSMKHKKEKGQKKLASLFTNNSSNNNKVLFFICVQQYFCLSEKAFISSFISERYFCGV